MQVPTESSRAGWRSHLAIALVSLAILLFEILITRVLSVTLAYHFAFLSVSLAMLGLGAPGVWFSLRPVGPRALPRVLVASGVLLPVSLLLIVNVGQRMRGVTAFWVLCLLLPLVALGSAVCMLLLEARGDRVGRMYAADLTGAGVGAIAAVPLLSGLPTPSVLAALGLLPLLAAFLIAPRSLRVVAALAIGLAVSVAIGRPYQLRYTKFNEDTNLLYERWTPTARLTISNASQFTGWGMGRNWVSQPPTELWIDQDGSAGTPIELYRPGGPFPPHLLFDVTSLPYELMGTGSRACIIGGGGGRDILTALSAHASDVEVVELNPWTVDAVSHVFRHFSGDPYGLPGVRTFVGEGRSHFARSRSKCDVFQISLIDTFAATAAGAYALTENSLYTVEALLGFWSTLTPRGMLSVSRWENGPGKLEAVRFALLAREALFQAGVEDPDRHLLIVKAQSTANTILLRQPVDDALLIRVGEIVKRRGYRVLWPLSPQEGSPSLVTFVLRHGTSKLDSLGLDLSPPTDDRPFFFQTLSVFSSKKWPVWKDLSEREGSVLLLRNLLALVGVLTMALFFAPLLARGRLPKGKAAVRGMLFFVSIGLGFMFVEIPLIHRLTLYLGHPSYATTVVLGALLLGAGTGSFFAAPLRRHASLVLLLVPLVIAATVTPLVGPIAGATQSWGFPARVITSALGALLAGAAMGLPFPLGMARFDDRDRSWFWAMNGAAGVLASVLALVLSLQLGFFLVIVIALVCYAIAALLGHHNGESQPDG